MEIQPEQEIRTVLLKPKWIPVKCPNCGGRRTVSYGRIPCPTCNALGYIQVPPEDGGVE